MNILIADDDPTSRTLLQAILSRHGYGIVPAADGCEAWNAFQKDDAPQLAVLDWMMPGMDGPTLCQKLRQQDRRDPLYLILLTARNTQPDIVTGLKAGADDFIAKPFNNDELLARVGVGRRMVELYGELRRRERFEGVLEMAGAVCHELNQPLQSVTGYCDMLLKDASPGNPDYKKLSAIKRGAETIARLTHKIMTITEYQSKPYLNRHRIVDLDKASGS